MHVIKEKDKQFANLHQRRWKSLPDESGKTKNLLLGITEIEPGDKTPVHKHEKSEEVIYVLKGSCKIYLPEFEEKISPGTVVYIPKNEEHSIEAIGAEKLKLICVFSPPLGKSN